MFPRENVNTNVKRSTEAIIVLGLITQEYIFQTSS